MIHSKQIDTDRMRNKSKEKKNSRNSIRSTKAVHQNILRGSNSKNKRANGREREGGEIVNRTQQEHAPAKSMICVRTFRKYMYCIRTQAWCMQNVWKYNEM